jgi:hypothetical protein
MSRGLHSFYFHDNSRPNYSGDDTYGPMRPRDYDADKKPLTSSEGCNGSLQTPEVVPSTPDTLAKYRAVVEAAKEYRRVHLSRLDNPMAEVNAGACLDAALAALPKGDKNLSTLDYKRSPLYAENMKAKKAYDSLGPDTDDEPFDEE